MPDSVYINHGRNARKNTVKSQIFDIDNGAGTTIDETILRPATAVTLLAVRVVYDDATTGTVAAATVGLGTTVGGVEVVAATALENTKTVGTTTALTLVISTVAAGTMITVRHTGVAATAAGKYHVELDFLYDD